MNNQLRSPREFDRAIETFVRGFCFTRSFTHPYVAHRVGRLWVMRDAPRKNPADLRNEEWVAHDIPPADVDAQVRANANGRFAISLILAAGDPEDPVRAAYKSLGYRLGHTEPFMLHRLARVPRLPEPFPIRRVMTQDLADRLAKAARGRQILPEHFADDAPMRQYVALDGETPVAWGRSITVADSTWVSNVYTAPENRRRGIARSLLARMLRDDRARGVKRSVLLASHTGALLYTSVGYETIGRLFLYTPVKKR